MTSVGYDLDVTPSDPYFPNFFLLFYRVSFAFPLSTLPSFKKETFLCTFCTIFPWSLGFVKGKGAIKLFWVTTQYTPPRAASFKWTA